MDCYERRASAHPQYFRDLKEPAAAGVGGGWRGGGGGKSLPPPRFAQLRNPFSRLASGQYISPVVRCIRPCPGEFLSTPGSFCHSLILRIRCPLDYESA